MQKSTFRLFASNIIIDRLMIAIILILIGGCIYLYTTTNKSVTMEEKVSGSWISEDGSYSTELFLNADGTGYHRMYYSGEWQDKTDITWTVEKDKYDNVDEEYEFIEIPDYGKFIINISSNRRTIYSLQQRAGNKIMATFYRSEE